MPLSKICLFKDPPKVGVSGSDKVFFSPKYCTVFERQGSQNGCFLNFALSYEACQWLKIRSDYWRATWACLVWSEELTSASMAQNKEWLQKRKLWLTLSGVKGWPRLQWLKKEWLLKRKLWLTLSGVKGWPQLKWHKIRRYFLRKNFDLPCLEWRVDLGFNGSK